MKELSVQTANGDEVDSVALIKGRLQYETGQAESIFEGKRIPGDNISDADLYNNMKDWSNGYIVIQEVDNSPQGWLSKLNARLG